MKQQIKHSNSEIVAKNLQYKIDNSSNNSKIAEILLKEQKGFCAYTDEFFKRTDAKDIEHFNPTLKGTEDDGYENWFLVKHQWNKEKSYKWSQFQPILHPTANDFEQRIVYAEGDYFSNIEADEEANNLIALLKLDDPLLAKERKNYINRKREEIQKFGQSATDFFTILINDDVCQVSFLRAIKETFNVDLWNILP